MSTTLPATALVELLEPALHDVPGPAYRRIADAIRLLVADGRLLHGTRLPSERALTEAIGVSRTTVTRI